MGNPVTGPNAAKVYIQRPFRRPANLFVTGFLPWPEDALAEEGNVPTFGFDGTPAGSASGARRSVRRAIQLWNEKAGERVFAMTPNKGEADVVVRAAPAEKESLATGAYPVANKKEQVRIRPDVIGSAEVVAHELGHTQGLRHLQMNPKPGIMRYGLPGGGAHRKQPTSREGQKVVHHQNTGATGGGSAAASNAATFNKAAKKPKKPANEHKVTGAGARKIAK